MPDVVIYGWRAHSQYKFVDGKPCEVIVWKMEVVASYYHGLSVPMMQPWASTTDNALRTTAW